MTSTVEQLGYRDVFARITDLAELLLAHPDRQVASAAAELLDWVDTLHRDGLGRLVEMIRAWRGETFLDAAAADEIAGTLLAAYGLGDDRSVVADAAEAVSDALEEVRPLVESHGGAIEVEDIADGVVRVRMTGTCDGCPSSAATLTYGVEAALRDHWRDFRRLELVDTAAEVDPAKADLACVTVPPGVDGRIRQPEPALLQIRGHAEQ